MKILIVDDESDIKSLFEQKFKYEIKNKIYEFSFCFTGEQAVEFLNQMSNTDVVLILSDINMPGMSGLELLKILKEKYNHLKVFMITAYDDEINHSSAISLGADNYLTKPIDFDRLKKSILMINNLNNK